jgi:hypothetical protein
VSMGELPGPRGRALTPHPAACAGRVGEGRAEAGPWGSARPPPAGRAAFLGGRRSDVDSGAAGAAGGRQPGGFLNPPPGPSPHFPSTAPPAEGERARERQRSREARRAPPAKAQEKLERA